MIGQGLARGGVGPESDQSNEYRYVLGILLSRSHYPFLSSYEISRPFVANYENTTECYQGTRAKIAPYISFRLNIVADRSTNIHPQRV
jgi:hypothetical protein